MAELIRKVADVLDGPEVDRERRAWSLVAIMVGAVGISRAMPDGEDANGALDHALETAVSLIGLRTGKSKTPRDG